MEKCSIFSVLEKYQSMYYIYRYGVREYACTAIDMIARRIRLAFLNVQAAQEALPEIINIMAEELGWSEDEKKVYYTCTICSKYVLLFIQNVLL